MGVDSVLFRPDDELKDLAELAVKHNLTAVFAKNNDAAATLAELEGSADGKKWIAAWEKAQEPWFNYTSGNGFYGSDVYWRDNLDLPMGYIQDYVVRAAKGEQLHRPKDELIAERDRITSEYAELLDGAPYCSTSQPVGVLAQTASHLPTGQLKSSVVARS